MNIIKIILKGKNLRKAGRKNNKLPTPK